MACFLFIYSKMIVNGNEIALIGRQENQRIRLQKIPIYYLDKQNK